MRRLIYAAVAAMVMCVLPVAEASAQSGRIGVQLFGGFTTAEDASAPVSVGAFFVADGVTVSVDTDVQDDGNAVTVGFGGEIGEYSASFYLATAQKASTTTREGAGDTTFQDETSHNALANTQLGVGVARSFYSLRWLTDGVQHTVQVGFRWAPIGG